MSAAEGSLGVGGPVDSPAADWTPAGRWAAAATLVLGQGLQLVANAIGPQDMSATTLDEVQWAADNPGAANLIFACALLSVPFLAAAAIVYFLLARRRAPRLAWAAGLLAGFGAVSLGAVEGFQTLAIALAEDERIEAVVLAEALDDAMTPAVIVMFLMFVPVALLGLLATVAALWRSRAVPRAAPLLILAAIIVDFFLAEGAGVAPSFLGPALGLAAALVIAWSVVRANRLLTAA